MLPLENLSENILEQMYCHICRLNLLIDTY